MAIVFRKKKTKTPQPKRELTPWEKVQRNQAIEKKKAEKEKKRSQTFVPKLKAPQKFWIWFSCVLILILIIAGYLLSPLSHIQSIEVTGNKEFSKTQIMKIGNVKKDDWIFPYLFGQRNKSTSVYKKQPKLVSYKIKRQGFNHLKVTVKENSIAGLVLRNKYYYTILDNGKVIKKSKKQPSSDYPVFKNFHSASVLKTLLTQFQELPSVVRTGISEIDYVPSKDNPNKLHLYMNDGNEVYAVLPTFAEKMKYYPQMAADMKQKGVIDLEVGAYSYPFKNKSKETATSSSSSSSSSVGSGSSYSTTSSSSSSGQTYSATSTTSSVSTSSSVASTN